MKIWKHILIVGMIIAMYSFEAHALTFKIGDPGGSFDLGQGWVDQPGGNVGVLNVFWRVDTGFANTQFDLNSVGDVFTKHFGTAELNSEVNIEGDETDFLDIISQVQLVLPSPLHLSSVGSVEVYPGSTCDNGCINNPDMTVADIIVTFPEVQMAFGNGGLLGLSFSPVVFAHNLSVEPIEVTFRLLSAPNPTTSAPEPAAWLLLGTGLVGLLGYGWRQKRAA